MDGTHEQWDRQQQFEEVPSAEGQFTIFRDGYGNFYFARNQKNNNSFESFSPSSRVSPPMDSTSSYFQQPSSRNDSLFEDFQSAAAASQQQQQHQHQPVVQQARDMGNSNFFINQLVGNWTPGTSILGDRMMSPPVAPIQVPENLEPRHIQIPDNNMASMNATTTTSQPPSTATAKKPRAVAEVKPMRMSYSDVLSKNVAPTVPQTPVSANNSFSAAPLPKKDKENKKAEKKFNLENGEKFRKREEKKAQAASVKVEPVEAKKKKPEGGKKGAKVSKAKPMKVTTSFSKLGDEFEAEATESEPPIQEIFENFYNVRKTENYEKVKSAAKKKSSVAKPCSKQQQQQQEKQAYKRQKGGRKSQRIQMLEKIWKIWLEYFIKLALWLFSLVSDIVYLSYGLAADRCGAGLAHVAQLYDNLRTELGNNTNRPSVWAKNLWNRFDARFDKFSRWAFWRRSFRSPPLDKNPSGADPKDYYKDGRLPSTADEAMYSLLNCKGKDAYSMLFLQKDCNQEQIRKHYKKIAVLVHPDKVRRLLIYSIDLRVD